MKRLTLTTVLSLAVASAFAGDFPTIRFPIDRLPITRKAVSFSNRLKYRPANWEPIKGLKIDMRAAYGAAFAFDAWGQTPQFPERHLVEIDPIAAPWVNAKQIGSGAYYVVSGLMFLGIDSLIDKQDDATRLGGYVVAFLAHCCTITNNWKLGVRVFSARF